MKTNLQLTKTPIAKAGMLAPRQGMEGAPDVWLEVSPRFIERLQDIAVGQEIIVITWLRKAKRNTLKVYPRGDESSPLAGVFSIRSPDRPNPLGLHRVTVREIVGDRIRIGPMEAVDGTPVADVKPLLPESADSGTPASGPICQTKCQI